METQLASCCVLSLSCMLHASELLGPFSALNVGYPQSEWISLKLGETYKVHAITLEKGNGGKGTSKHW
jgi:hypothetical protein